MHAFFVAYVKGSDADSVAAKIAGKNTMVTMAIPRIALLLHMAARAISILARGSLGFGRSRSNSHRVCETPASCQVQKATLHHSLFPHRRSSEESSVHLTDLVLTSFAKRLRLFGCRNINSSASSYSLNLYLPVPSQNNHFERSSLFITSSGSWPDARDRQSL